MICPNCRAEYREGYYVCRDCGVDLVPELPPQTAMPPRYHPHAVEYTPLLSVENRNSYETVRAHLEAAEIDYIPRPNVIGRLAFPISIEVRKEEDELARDLLAQLDLSLADPFQEDEVAGTEASPRRADPAVETPEKPAAHGDGQPAVSLEIEAALVKEGKYLAFGAEEAFGSDVSLPGGPVPPAMETGDALEGALRRLLAERYGIETDGEPLYVGSRFDVNQSGRAAVRVTFLLRWQGGERIADGGRWYYASDLERLPGIPPGLSALIRRADGLRLDKGW